MMVEHDAKHLLDNAAGMTGLVTVISYWAGILTPILSFLVLAATLGWWLIRYREWWLTGRVADRPSRQSAEPDGDNP
ncbi:hypothetical protein AQZ52_10870 [Novosphingobium fuchskuhlense]|uniref:Uncharacterized protein n=1 Tax=Novosphingobium fuchskuhlense TaxID=1117702 RepID=A0A117UUM3_9SPHN|nr:hypothetical protein [Novosphingobium fuchskuhlense]KUR71166.1 hypothetical protein AQZ52_10870 [Novosphingobium fuchskuhlense]